MRQSDLLRLLALAAIWGASFLFMRIIAPALGALWTTETRVGLAGLVMLAFMAFTGRRMNFRENWKPFLILGALNSALPFAMYAFAALTLPAGYSAIVNATTPLWGALVGALVLGEKLGPRKIAGLILGVIGVAFVVRLGPAAFSHEVLIAALACVIAAMSYGVAGAYSKKASVSIPPPIMATGSMLGATVVLLPFLPLSPMRGEVTGMVVVSVLALALLCSAVAYVIYFRLIADLGPTRAMTVTFLIPLFALLWGALFLGETINLNTIIGCALVVLATWLVVFQPKPAAATAS